MCKAISLDLPHYRFKESRSHIPKIENCFFGKALLMLAFEKERGRKRRKGERKLLDRREHS